MTGYTWNGTNSSFADAANWSPQGVPGVGDVAFITSGTASAQALTLTTNDLPSSIVLGGDGTAGTLTLAPTGDSEFAGSLASGAITASGYAGGASDLDITGEFDVGPSGILSFLPVYTSRPAGAASAGTGLTIALSPTASGGLGVLLAEPASILALVDSTITADKTADRYDVAFVNDNRFVSADNLTVDVPVYEQAGSTGGFLVESGQLEFGASVADQTVTLSGGNLVLDDVAHFAGTIASFPSYGAPNPFLTGTTIDLRGVSADSLQFVAGTTPGVSGLNLMQGPGIAATLETAAAPFGASVASDGRGGTLLTIDLVGQGGADFIDLPGAHDAYTISNGSSGIVVTGSGRTDTVSTGSSLRFTDGVQIEGATTPEAALDRLYQAAVGRAPDGSGFGYWDSFINATSGIEYVATMMMQTAEYAAEYQQAGATDAGFVDKLYTNTLDRSADQGGEAYWIGQLQAGQSRGSVMAAFVNTAEAMQRNAAQIGNGLFIANG